ncbi:universal stress protein [Algoriphagus namhaensis]
MTKVLVPYDFSEQAQHALDFALKIGETIDNIHIEVLHVMEVPTHTGFGTMGGGETVTDMENQIFFVELMEKRKEQIEELRKTYEDSPFTFEAKIKLGNAFKSISASINEENPDLVIMGSKGVSGVEEVLIGSNTEKVVRTAPCPVVTIKGPVDPADINKIVFASDFENESAEVAARIKRLAHILQAELFLVYVNTPGDFETSRESIARIRSFAKKYDLSPVKAEIYNSRSEESGIVEFAEDIDADLIAMTTHGRTGFLHLVTGSIAEDVVNHAKRPVWTFKLD